MLLKLYQAGQPILRQKARAVSPKQLAGVKTQALIDDMIATLRDAPGVGLSAPQIGVLRQIAIIDDKADYHENVPVTVLEAQGRKPIGLQILVNPTVRMVDQKQALFFEGCLSIDGYVAAVPRAKAVHVNALDRHGKPMSFTAHGWHARIVQHEVAHLQGTLYIDVMLKTSFMTLKNFVMHWRKALQAEIKTSFKD